MTPPPTYVPNRSAAIARLQAKLRANPSDAQSWASLGFAYVQQARVSAETGIAVSTVSEILAGKRGLSRKHIEALARYFRVSPSLFMRV